jgi:hypothetical protein
MQSAITCREGNQLQQAYAFASRSGGYLWVKWWDGPHWACLFSSGEWVFGNTAGARSTMQQGRALR